MFRVFGFFKFIVVILKASHPSPVYKFYVVGIDYALNIIAMPDLSPIYGCAIHAVRAELIRKTSGIICKKIAFIRTDKKNPGTELYLTPSEENAL